MKASRINLIPSVRRGLINAGYSTVKVVSAVNAALGELANIATTEKAGDGSLTKSSFKVTNTVTFKYEGKRTLPLVFDAWHSKQSQADKIASMEVVEVPSIFHAWLDKFAKADAKQSEIESQELAAVEKASKE